MNVPLTVIVVMLNDFPVHVCLQDNQANEWITEDRKTRTNFGHSNFAHYHKHTFVIGEDEPLKTLAEVEQQYVLQVLALEPNKERAAQLLGMGKSTLYRKLKDWSIDQIKGDSLR